MSVWHGAQARRRTAVALAAVSLAVSLTACGGTDDDGKSGADSSSSAPAADKSKAEDQGKDDGPTVPDTSKTLATINGSDGIQVLIHTAERDSGGFLTITGTVKNTSGGNKQLPLQWNGLESQIKSKGRSFAGMTLVDKAEKKRYYVLRDTDANPLTTTGITRLDGGTSVAFFAQFPAPPSSTTQVDLQLPVMPTATIEIS
ncbi:hypothetical protein [Streptomyces corynorhini]|uniref:DUF4352 domain-containing protein n=1 Tax=Streptomyces corynorhini TaxID=2282652 RepID=A0A370BIL2_9ACTN|nr:hypothetical protein [Streptomyces corynorhini]RDG40134.1 hypothetical protein DVH02_00280 [Streptomyces corynorhini]